MSSSCNNRRHHYPSWRAFPHFFALVARLSAPLCLYAKTNILVIVPSQTEWPYNQIVWVQSLPTCSIWQLREWSANPAKGIPETCKTELVWAEDESLDGLTQRFHWSFWLQALSALYILRHYSKHANGLEISSYSNTTQCRVCLLWILLHTQAAAPTSTATPDVCVCVNRYSMSSVTGTHRCVQICQWYRHRVALKRCLCIRALLFTQFSSVWIWKGRRFDGKLFCLCPILGIATFEEIMARRESVCQRCRRKVSTSKQKLNKKQAENRSAIEFRMKSEWQLPIDRVACVAEPRDAG